MLDELDLAVSPLMGSGGQIVLGEPDLVPARFHLTQVLTADSFLFTRYLRNELSTEPDTELSTEPSTEPDTKPPRGSA
jgi:hypothetical protein